MKERKENFNNLKRAIDKVNDQVLRELDNLIAKKGKKGMSLSDCWAFMEERQDEHSLRSALEEGHVLLARLDPEASTVERDHRRTGSSSRRPHGDP